MNRSIALTGRNDGGARGQRAAGHAAQRRTRADAGDRVLGRVRVEPLVHERTRSPR